MIQEKYEYRNLPIPGGGYVTGFTFHPKKKDLLYIRTDIGGVYRFQREQQRWKSLIDHVTMDDLSETFPAAVALDPEHPERLYIACGIDAEPQGMMAVSEDCGESFVRYPMPMNVHGNKNGRGTGYRLIVDRNDPEVLWFASQKDGLWKSADRGAHWEKNTAFPDDYMTFVGQTDDGGVLFAACAGVTTKRGEKLRGHSLFVSYDGGQTFEELWQPRDGEIEGVRLAGLVAQRYAMDEKNLYVTYSVMGRNAYVYELGYSCDGGSVIGGKIVRYPLTRQGNKVQRMEKGEDITPVTAPPDPRAGDGSRIPAQCARKESAEELLEYGFSGIAVTAAVSGLVVASTISKEDGDCIFRSMDYGQTWECILYDLEIGELDFRTSYLKPCYNGGHSLIHWLTDLKIDPYRPDEVWFNTGTGVFRSRNLTGQKVVFEDWSDGIEETVHLNLYSPPKGEVKLIDILGDLGGFAFRELDRPCDNSFDDAEGNRYITCINADYSDLHPECLIVTPRGNWKGKTKGGLILSEDQCRTFRRLPMPFGVTPKLDEVLHRIEQPNVNSGWAALSPDCCHIVWSVAENITLPVDQVLVSHDCGESFQQVRVYEADGKQKTEGGFKVFADRVNSDLFYGFGEHSDFYVSEDAGESFSQIRPVIDAAPWASGAGTAGPCGVDFSLIDCANKTEVRGENGREGVFYLALKEQGLWKYEYDREKKQLTLTRLGREGDVFYRMGLGVGREGGDYLREAKAIYVAARIDGSYGFYRTVDEGKSYVRLNTEKQMYGEINSMEGDGQEYGRFYIATGSRGVLYGEPAGK